MPDHSIFHCDPLHLNDHALQITVRHQKIRKQFIFHKNSQEFSVFFPLLCKVLSFLLHFIGIIRFGKLLCQRQDLRQIILIQTFFLIIDSQILQKLIAFIHGIQKRQINRKDRRFQFFHGFSGEIVLDPFF